ncbi:MAG TPA: hypothetical protein VF690_07755 [Hymenobacter sp.]
MRPTEVLLCLAVALGGGACSGTHDSPSRRPARAAAQPRPPAPTLDVPSLLSLSIDEMPQRLGARLPVPAGFTDPVMRPLAKRREQTDSTVFFRYQNLAVAVNYNHRTRQVNDLLLLGANENEMMRRAHLQLDAKTYLVLPVFQERDPTKLLGLRVLVVAGE